jgi:arylsulfatase A-like enzyme
MRRPFTRSRLVASIAGALLVWGSAGCGGERRGAERTGTPSSISAAAKEVPTPARWGPPSGRPPLVILVSLDTLRADHLGLYGYGRPTSPVLDALALESAVFDDASTPAPWTLPAHASMMTGLYPVSNGVVTDVRLPDGVPTLAGILRARGFTTAAVVNVSWLKKESYGVTRDFDHYLWVEESVDRASPSTWVTDQAIEWLKARRDDEPMFLFVHYFDAHADYVSLPEYENLFVRPYDGTVKGTALELTKQDIDPVLVEYCRTNSSEANCIGSGILEGVVLDENFERRVFDDADIQHLVDLYDAGVRQLDAEIGRLFRYLDEAGLAEQALLVVVSDHGEEFAEHGGTAHMRTQYQEVVRACFLLRGPGVPAGVRYETPVSLVDLAPTILSFAGIPRTTPMEGLDLSVLWTGGDRSQLDSRLIFHEASRAMGDRIVEELGHSALQSRAVRRGRFKLYYSNRAEPNYVLFDLEADPGETRDVTEEHPELAAELRRVLEERDAIAKARQEAPAVKLDPEEEARLKALGYLR